MCADPRVNSDDQVVPTEHVEEQPRAAALVVEKPGVGRLRLSGPWCRCLPAHIGHRQTWHGSRYGFHQSHHSPDRATATGNSTRWCIGRLAFVWQHAGKTTPDVGDPDGNRADSEQCCDCDLRALGSAGVVALNTSAHFQEAPAAPSVAWCYIAVSNRTLPPCESI